MPVSSAIPVLALLALFAAATTVSAAPRRGHDVPVATFRVAVDLDASTVVVEEAGARLAGIKLDATLASQDALARSATLTVSVRNDSDRTLLHEIEGELLGGGDLDPAGTWTIPSELLRRGTSTNPAEWTVFHGDLRAWTMKVRLLAGVPLVAGEKATIRHAGGLRVRVPEGGIPYEAFVDVEPVDEADPTANPGDMEWIGGARLTLHPTAVHSGMPPPDLPVEVRIGAKQAFTEGAEFVAALLADAESVAEDENQQGAALLPHWLPLADAVARGGKLQTLSSSLPGVFHAGTWGFFRVTPRLFVRGTVRDSAGARGGSIVKAAHSPAIAVTDSAGRYALAVPQTASVVVTALDPLRGQRGVAAGGVAGGVRSLDLDVTVAPMSGEVVTRDGIRNGGFEADDLSSWVTMGAASALASPLSCSGGSVSPSEGASMASLTTVAPDLPASSLSQPFDVPSGARTLSFDYDVLSSEFTTGAPAPDVFVATAITPGGDVEVARVTTDDPTGTALLGDCGDGENWAHTGWRTASIDLSAYSGEPASRVRLVFSVASAVDASLPTRVLVDNIRFSTLWVAPKAVGTAIGNQARADAMAEAATLVLRQAGINVRTRPLGSVPDPGGTLSVLDITPTGSGACGADTTRQDIDLTAEMSQLLVLGRSPVATDLNAWWVSSFTGASALGYAVGPDDFCSQVTLATNGGILLVDSSNGDALSHESGHVLLSPISTGSTSEHGAAAGNFMLTNTPPLGAMTRPQSANINRPGAPLLVP